MDEFGHGQVLWRRLKVLSQRKYLAVDAAEVVHGFDHFFKRFPQAEHHARLGLNPRLSQAAQHFEAAVVFGLNPDFLGQSAHRLEVV